MKLNDLFDVVESYEKVFLCIVRDDGQEKEIGILDMELDGEIGKYAQKEVINIGSTNTGELSITVKEENDGR